MLARRSILIAPLALGACAGTGGTTNVGQTIALVSTDVGLIANALSKSLVQIQALDLPALTQKVLDTMQAALAGVQSVAKAIGGVDTLEGAKPLVSQVAAYATAFLDAAQTLPLPKEIKTALAAAGILIPVIELAVNLAVSRASTAPMTPGQARSTLK